MSPVGELVVRVGVPPLDDYLEFLAGRARPSEPISSLFAIGGVQNELEDLLGNRSTSSLRLDTRLRSDGRSRPTPSNSDLWSRSAKQDDPHR